MHHHFVGIAGILTLASPLISTTAIAQERSTSSYFSEQVAAPSHALELNVGTGYTQGFGMVAPGRGVPSVAGAGLGANLAIDYRLNPHWSVGLESQYQEFVSEDNASSRGLSGNVGATYHFSPTHGGDPWVRLGTGYRFLWENDPAATPGVTVMRHGLELAAVKLGYDVRVSEDVAIAPVIGADVNLFLWQDGTGSGNHALASAQAGTFVYAGLPIDVSISSGVTERGTLNAHRGSSVQ